MATPSMSIHTSLSAAAWRKMDAELAGFSEFRERGAYRAIKKTVDQGVNMIFDRFKQQYPNVQKSKIATGDPTKRRRPIVGKVVPGQGSPFGVITVSNVRIPMIAFKPKGGGMKIPTMGKGHGVIVTMDNAKGQQQFRHAFRAKMRSGHEGVFMRARASLGQMVTGRAKINDRGYVGRLKIVEMFGPNMYTLVNVPAINAEVEAKLDAILAKNIQGQIDRFLKPPTKKAG